MLAVHRLFEINPVVAKQALVWGLGGALASKFGEDKPKTEEEKKELRKKILAQGLIGAAAGALSTAI